MSLKMETRSVRVSCRRKSCPVSINRHKPAMSCKCSSYICTSVVGCTVSEMKKQVVEGAKVGAQIVELRLDYMFHDCSTSDSVARLETLVQQATDLVSTCRDSGVKSIATIRPSWEGGEFLCDIDGELDRKRVAALRAIAESSCVDFIDCEMLAAQSLFYDKTNICGESHLEKGDVQTVTGGRWQPGTKTKLILSRHDYEKTPTSAELSQWQNDIFKLGADIAKIACTANDITDCARIISLMDFERINPTWADSEATSDGNDSSTIKRTIALSMGEMGLITRLLAPKLTGFLTFGALDEARASAPGYELCIHYQ